MFLKNLIRAVASIDCMPIEVTDLSEQLIAAGCQDKIVFHPTDEDPGTFHGTYYRYTEHSGAYSQPEFTTLIVFSKHLEFEWQRMVCCKELIHACDKEIEQTNTKEEVEALLEKVLGPLTPVEYGLADLMAAKDKLALYQALALLFPPEAREQAVKALEAATDKQTELERIARWASLPYELVELVMQPGWPAIRKQLLDGGDE